MRARHPDRRRRGPRHQQAGEGEVGAEAGLEEAEAQAQHGHGDEAKEDNVDILAVKSGLQWSGAQVAQSYQQLKYKNLDEKLQL